jgi:pimeloyl-ACP methyl ester carboxylesterase
MDPTLPLRDGRTLAWREWGVPDGTPVLRLQGTPGSRLSRYPRLELWARLGVRVLMADRPGFGGSTRAPGHGLLDVADDLVELLDRLGLERVPVIGGSGGGPHVLAFCARHPDRVASATVVVGTAPVLEEDLLRLIPINAEAWRRARRGWSDVHQLCVQQRDEVLADPLGAFRGVMQKAPPGDREVLEEPEFQRVFAEGVTEALRPGAEGWADESVLLSAPWDETEVPPEGVRSHVVWWHGRHDANAPLSAVERFTTRMPSVELRIWDGGHLEPYRREEQILTDLLGR